MADNSKNLDVVAGASLATVIFTPPQSAFNFGVASYAITGGADSTHFALVYEGPNTLTTASRARLLFNTEPDLAQPVDAGRDNTYDVEVTETRLGITTTTAYSLHVVPDDYADNANTTGVLSTDGAPSMGAVTAQNDTDWFRFDSKGGDYLISIPSLSGYTVYTAAGAFVASAGGNSSTLSMMQLPAGTLYLAVGNGGYLPRENGAYTVAISEGGSTIRVTDQFSNAVREGTDRADIIQSSGGADTLNGLGGGDYIYGNAGDDLIDGGAGRDYLRGEAGNDSILGGADDDDINGNQGVDTLRGGEGNDWVVGGQDADLLDGENGADIVYGNLGDDTATGGAGDDWVRGGQGDDVLFGGAGADFMSGDRGSDTLYGGEGSDRFNLIAGAGIDRVMDFNSAQGDRVTIEGGLTYTLSFSGGDAHITLSDGSDMVLVGVSNADALGPWLLAG